MIQLRTRGLAAKAYALLAAMMVIVLIAGCGGGGGGSSSSSNTGGTTPTTPTPQATSVSVAGTLRDTTTGILLPQRIVKVSAKGSTYTGTTDSAGHFVIANVPITTITVTITDSNGTPQGSTLTFNLSSLSGNPRVLSANDSSKTYINIDISQLPGLPGI